MAEGLTGHARPHLVVGSQLPHGTEHRAVCLGGIFTACQKHAQFIILAHMGNIATGINVVDTGAHGFILCHDVAGKGVPSDDEYTFALHIIPV